MNTLHVAHLGPTSYRDGLALQEALVLARAAGRTGDWLLYPDHPPVVTIGRGGGWESLKVTPEALEARGIEIVEVTRGGDVTWHGPGQLVGYPILHMDRLGRDTHRLLRETEAALIEAASRWGIEARTIPGRTGVWVGEEKLASIGVAVRRWVSYHGFALNVSPDLSDFSLMHPCGLHGISMTSLARLLGEKAPGMDEARSVVTRALARRLGYEACVTATIEEVTAAAA